MRKLVARCRVPASSANLGPGFDTFSMALEEPNLVVEAILDEGLKGIEVEPVGKYAERVSKDPEKNSAAIALRNAMSRYGLNGGVRLRIEARIPVRRGLGSSGAEAVGAVITCAELFNLKLNCEEVIELAAKAEPGEHADNVTASALGGFNVLVKSGGSVKWFRIEPPENLGLVVIVPSIEKDSTKAAREVLPEGVELERYVEGMARSSLVAIAMATRRLDVLLENVPFDPVVEKARANAGIYGRDYNWEELSKEKRKLLERYGVALTISGAGPSRLLWYDMSANEGEEGSRPIDLAVAEVVESLKERGYDVEEVFYTKPSNKGAELFTRP